MNILALLLLVASFFLQVLTQPYHTLVAPIKKDKKTSLYTVTINSYSSHDHYVIDLNAPFSWIICNVPHNSVACSSPQCIQARTSHRLSSGPACSPADNIIKRGQCQCLVTPSNPISKTCALSQLSYKDIIMTNGKRPTGGINFNQLYMSCAPASLLTSFPKNSVGLVSLSWSPLSLPSQFTPEVIKKFAICLPSESTKSSGVIFFGDGPIYLLPFSIDIANLLTYTPLIRKNKSDSYYISVKMIFVGERVLELQQSVFDFDNLGRGGVKLSTTTPYTTLRSDIYKLFFKQFSKATNRYPIVNKVSPFPLCFNSTLLGSTRVGLSVPQIDFGLGNGTIWSILGANTMKQVSNDVACLAFIDGGENAEEAIAIGAFQMENNLLEFDLAGSRLGFSSSWYLDKTTCSNFNTSPQLLN